MTPVVRNLLIANVVVFFLQQMALGPYLGAFVFEPAAVLTRPWTLVTYMFLHAGLWHLFGNMLGLYFFGQRVEERIGSRAFTTLYFISGISGALLSLVLGGGAPIIGASGGVFGVTLAFAYFWPTALIYIWGVIPVPAWLLVIGYGMYSIFRGGVGGDNIAHFAHLGGYAGAFAYLKWLERGKGAFRKKVTAPPPEVDRRLSGWQQVDTARVHEVNRDEVDRILDKISAKGLPSLTAEERVFLSHFVPPDDRVPPVQ